MEHTKNAFDNIAAEYDAQRKYIIPLMDEYYGAAVWAAELPEGQPAILDIGAGTGLLSALRAAKFPTASLTLMDISENMLDIARERCPVCLDYASNLADISAGSAGSPDNWSTVFVRTKAGHSVWDKALAAGCFETKPMENIKPGLGLTKALATDKIARNTMTLEERATMGVGKGLRNPYL